MKSLKSRMILMGLLFTAGIQSAVWAKSGVELLQEAIYAEEIEGDLPKAIDLFDQIITTDDGKRSNIAQALYRKGLCFMALNKEQQARQTLEDLVNKYSEESLLIAQAQQILNELSMVDPAALMPADVLSYVEIGSPGHQVEVILRMIQGTPMEAALNSIGPSNGGVAALLNPSMIAELKKIKGMAAGILDFKNNQPPWFIVALYPGQSDALWGMLKAQIGIMGKPGEAIGEFQTAGLNGVIYVAYNDSVLIASGGPDILKEAVAKYRGTSQEASLASNTSFIESIGKNARQSNTLTVWQDVDSVYAKMLELIPPNQLPPKLMMINELVDLASINQLVLELKLEDRRIALDGELGFKSGYQGLAYSLLRTPSLTKVGYAGVPTDSIGLLSFRLSDPEAKVQQIEEMGMITGLDIIRDLVTNVKQVNLFAGPVDDLDLSTYADLISSVGLIATSQNSRQSAVILNRYLKRFVQQKQIGQANVLALNPKVVEQCVETFEDDDSISRDGPLQSSLSQRPLQTSKAAVVNLGGALDLLGPIWMAFAPEAIQDTMEDDLETLAEALHATNLELYTVETDDSLRIHLSINDLPLLKTLGPLMKVNVAMKSARSVKQSPVKSDLGNRNNACEDVWLASEAIVVDGNIEDWPSGASKPRPLLLEGEDGRTSAAWVTYDSDYLYLLMTVADPIVAGSSSEFWNNDGVQIFIDTDNRKGGSFGNNDYHFLAYWFNGQPVYDEIQHKAKATDLAQMKMVKTDSGYTLEARFSWEQLGVTPNAGAEIGFDLRLGDTDDGHKRKAVMTWNDKQNEAMYSPVSWGTLQLQDRQDVRPAPEAIVVDGQIEAAWDGASSFNFQQSMGETIYGAPDFHPSARMAYDENYLYVLFEVTDDAVVGESSSHWRNDCVEIFIDADNGKSTNYWPDDYQFYATWQNGAPQYGERKMDANQITEWAMVKTSTGYVAEARLSWSQLNVVPEEGTRLGIELHVCETDNGQQREAVYSWRDHNDQASSSPSSFGTIVLKKDAVAEPETSK
ncbi:sugar-binding protein [Pontiellaceae bacterium B1224]|nr:sugar-binding protein [Pontiellaceae bacterium B1224]